MRYIAALDYDHLDNGMFLSALARSISQQEGTQPIIIHGDSEYTDRIMQTGVMRDEAKVRSIKDLNHRLIALLADEGVSAVGINGYQRGLITRENNQLSLDNAFFDQMPDGPALLISTLIWDIETASVQPVSLTQMVSFLRSELKAEAVFAFSAQDKDEIIINRDHGTIEWKNLPEGFREKSLPEEFRDFDEPLHLSTARDFSDIKQNNHAVFIR